jgi:tetratricopeptide (TPR) repeat protein
MPQLRGQTDRSLRLFAGLTAALFAVILFSSPHSTFAQDEAHQIVDEAEALFARADYPAAAPRFEQALALAPKLYGPNELYVGEICHDLGATYAAMGQYAKAEPVYHLAIKIYEANKGTDALVANTVNNLAILYVAQADYAKAEPLYKRALKIRESIEGSDSRIVADTLNNIGILYRTIGRYKEAETALKRSINIYVTQIKPNDLMLAKACNNLEPIQ